MSIIKIRTEPFSSHATKQIKWVSCANNVITFHNIDLVPLKIEGASNKELRDPILAKVVLLEQRKSFSKGKQLRETCIDYVDFASSKFQFIDNKFTRKVFDGKRLLESNGFSLDMQGLLGLFEKIGIKIKSDNYRDISDIKELKAEYIDAICKLGLSPVDYDALIQNLMTPLTVEKKGPNLERLLSACRRNDECWKDAFYRFAHEVEFTPDELVHIKSCLKERTETIPS